MNILWDGVILKNMPTGGVARYCTDAIQYLSGQPDIQVMAACPKGAPAYAATSSALKQISLRGNEKLNQFRISLFKPDIFQSGYYGPSLCPGRPHLQIAYDFLDARYPVFRANPPDFVQHQKRVLESADHVIAISESTREDVCTFTQTPVEKVSVIYPAVNEVFTSPMLVPEQKQDVRDRFSKGKPYWLWVGPTQGYKNFRTFLKAFARTAQQHDMHLVLVGGKDAKPDPDIIEILQAEKVLDRVLPSGRVSDETLRQLYGAATALVQSSLWEGFGIPVVEALCCGTDLILSDIPVFHEVAGSFARYADPFSVEAWIQCLKDTHSGTTSHDVHVERKAATESKFSPEQVFKDLPAIYRNL